LTNKADQTLVERKLIEDLLYGDEKFVREFAAASVQSFSEFAENYRTFLLQRNETNFRKVGHKIKPVAQMLNLEMIIDEYEHAKTLLLNADSDESDLVASADRIDEICKQVIADLEAMQ